MDTIEFRSMQLAVIDVEMKRAENVLNTCKKLEELYNKNTQETIQNENRLSKIYDDLKERANIEEKKRRENNDISMLSYKNYFNTIEEKLHSSTRKAMLRRIDTEEKNEKSLRETYVTKWKILDSIECKRRESIKCFYLHSQEQYNALINDIIYTEAQAKLAFSNYNIMLENSTR